MSKFTNIEEDRKRKINKYKREETNSKGIRNHKEMVSLSPRRRETSLLAQQARRK